MMQPPTEVLHAIESAQALKDTIENGPDAQIDFDRAIRAKRDQINALYGQIETEVTALAHLLVARMCSRPPASIVIPVKEKPSSGSGFRAGDGYTGQVEIVGAETD